MRKLFWGALVGVAATFALLNLMHSSLWACLQRAAGP